MTVILKMDTGDSYSLDRNLRSSEVQETINDARGKGKLIPFDDNRTPRRIIYIDPDHVISVRDDGFSY